MSRVLTFFSLLFVAGAFVGCGQAELASSPEPEAPAVEDQLEAAGMSDEDYMKAMQEARKKSGN